MTSHGELRTFVRRIVVLGVIAVDLLLVGALGLAISEGVGYWYAFRWALDTAATVGGFPQPHTVAGQVIQVGLIVVGVGTLFYALATVARVLRRRPPRRPAGAAADAADDRLAHDHHIICGFGRVGRQVAARPGRRRAPLRRRRLERREPRLAEADGTCLSSATRPRTTC